ncbi:5-formyltetrahydrofolate cyclo-ligase [Bizionia argentinensis JUB59]|uniref:5-formyltetrahydrofolate cyclo-ligase n=1 Tax=Bizionia argentinensis JUB59 TaxID=1046627 RepID=G2EH52_9FLAO|nr:5-formyltetrahydrofolate cyclo-ligase [Bizionia argentinensis]EGV42276.1 5-formyltetrahydrofolate cyclo-ligase [Bizionia argentinensis JUB59]
MTKQELRKIYKQNRQELSNETLDELSLQIANKLLELPIWDSLYYHIFLSITEHKEINTDYILSILSGKDKHIIVSKTDFETRSMANFLLTDATVIKKNAYNIPEPVDGIPIDNSLIDVVFIPLLAFDKLGHRVGYGKGFYDTFLSKCKPETIKIGLSFFEAENEIKGIFDTDIPLNYCVTPNKTYTF